MNVFHRLDASVLPWVGRMLAPFTRPPQTPGHRAIRRVILLVGALVALLLVTAGVYALRADPGTDGPAPSVPVRVGVVDGQRVDDYAAGARAELDALRSRGTARTYALVSLATYNEPASLVSLLRQVPVVRAYARVPLPRTRTETVALRASRLPRDVVADMSGVAGRKRVAALDADRTARTLSGSDSDEARLRQYYLESSRVLRQEADGYGRACACVYAVVVRATPVRLAELARRPGVRVVDAAPKTRELDATVFLPLLPEIEDVVAPLPEVAVPAS